MVHPGGIVRLGVTVKPEDIDPMAYYESINYQIQKIQAAQYAAMDRLFWSEIAEFLPNPNIVLGGQDG